MTNIVDTARICMSMSVVIYERNVMLCFKSGK